MKTFFDWLEDRVRAVDSLLCVGLDPRVETVDALHSECVRLIDETVDFAALFKPNIGFFEAFGPAGLEALVAVIRHVPREIPVLLDAKRGDIASTSIAYAHAVFHTLGAHAVTVSPYLGHDAVAPFLADPARAAFVLCKTSNPDSDEFQALCVTTEAGGRMPLYQYVAERAAAWDEQGNVGLVVGATDPAAMARVRAAAPDLWILAPGIGDQGGALAATVAAGLRDDGMGLLLNASRQIARAESPHTAARQLRDAINQARTAAQSRPKRAAMPTPFAQLAHDLVASECIRFGEFTLKSGVVSPIYMDLRRLVSHPPILGRVAQAYAATLRSLTYDRLAGIPYAALPIATAIALETNQPMVFPRREAKAYGARATVEGVYHAGETVVVIDDLTTTGDSKFEAIQKLEEAGLVVRDVVVLIDRMQGAADVLAQAGYRLHSVISLPALLDEWLRQRAITAAQHTEVMAFLTAGQTTAGQTTVSQATAS